MHSYLYIDRYYWLLATCMCGWSSFFSMFPFLNFVTVSELLCSDLSLFFGIIVFNAKNSVLVLLPLYRPVEHKYRGKYVLSPLKNHPKDPANRRRFQKPKDPNAPNFYYKKAEDIPGYQKFTLDEVIYPEETNNEVSNIWETTTDWELICIDNTRS